MNACAEFHAGTTEVIIRSLLNESEWAPPSGTNPGEVFRYELAMSGKTYRGAAVLSAFGDVAEVLSVESDHGGDCIAKGIAGLGAASHELVISDAYWRRQVVADHQRAAPLLIGQDQLGAYRTAEQRYNINRSISCPVAFAFTGPRHDHPAGNGSSSATLGLVEANEFHALVSSYASRLAKPALDLAKGIPMHRSAIDKLRLKLAGETETKFWPTSSVRTMMAEDGSIHIKSSYPYTLSSRPRHIQPGEAKSAIHSTNTLVSLIDQGSWPRGWHILPELYAFHHKRRGSVGVIVRGGLAHIYPSIAADAWVISAFALTNPAPDGRPSVVQELCRKFGCDPQEWFERASQLLLRGATELVYQGISHESHGQNTLIVISRQTGQVEGICLRDLESTKLDAGKLRRWV